MRTSLANDFVVDRPSEMLLHDVLVRRVLDLPLNPIHQRNEELVSIHLLKNVGWIAVVILEGVAEIRRVEVLFIAEGEIGKKVFQLKKHVIFLSLACIVNRIHYPLPKRLNHKQLLK